MKASISFVIFAMIICLLIGCSGSILQADNTADNGSSQIDSTDNTGSTGNTENSVDVPWEHEAMLSRFLEETNHNGQIAHEEQQVAPGTLPEMRQIPQPSQTRVGEKVSVILTQRQQATPFYYSCSENGKERLAVFIVAERIPMLMVFETQLGGIAELCKQISAGTAFQGVILAMVNISFEEGNVYAQNVCGYSDDIPAAELLVDGTALVAAECLGIVGTSNDGSADLVIKGGVYQSASQALREDIDWMREKFTRYGLNEIMS